MDGTTSQSSAVVRVDVDEHRHIRARKRRRAAGQAPRESKTPTPSTSCATAQGCGRIQGPLVVPDRAAQQMLWPLRATVADRLGEAPAVAVLQFHQTRTPTCTNNLTVSNHPLLYQMCAVRQRNCSCQG